MRCSAWWHADGGELGGVGDEHHADGRDDGAAKVASIGTDLYGLVAYVEGTGGGADLWGRRWRRVLGLPGPEHDAVVRRVAPEVLDARLGNLVRVAWSSVVGVVSARDPELLAVHGDVLAHLSEWLEVPAGVLGVYGSAMYKRAAERGDLDFVVYGEQEGRRAWSNVCRRLPSSPRLKGGRPYHLHFPGPGGAAYLDPRFVRTDTDTVRLVGAAERVQDGGPVRGLAVVDDRDGMFFPASYRLGDGSTLLSYRLGHSALLRRGDRISAAALPVVELGGVVHRLVLRYEHLTVEDGRRQRGRGGYAP